MRIGIDLTGLGRVRVIAGVPNGFANQATVRIALDANVAGAPQHTVDASQPIVFPVPTSAHTLTIDCIGPVDKCGFGLQTPE
jgi:hypothetical protein